MNRFDRWLLRLLVAFALVTVSVANQAPLFSPTVSPVSGLQLTNNFNSGIDAINTCNSGATAPANQLTAVPSAGNCWLDTSLTPYKWKIYDGTQWTTVAFLDQVNHYWTPVVGGGPINSIASAATTDLCNATNGQPAYVSITGVVSITSFGSNCTTGQVKFGVFTGVLTFTHNAASLILPFNGSNITTAAGDTFTAVYLGGGNWRVTNYQKATGSPSIPAPTVQKFISGTSLTYTPTSGTVRIHVRMCGPGAGGAAQITNSGNASANNTVFGSWTAVKGTGGTVNGNGGAGGTGGTDVVDANNTLIVRLPGGAGHHGASNNHPTGDTQMAISGGGGGVTVFGGGGAPTSAAGGAAATNSCAGGAAAVSAITGGGANPGGGGGAGEYVEFLVTNPSPTTYTVGVGGTGGAAGTVAGGGGANGVLIIIEYYSFLFRRDVVPDNDNIPLGLNAVA